MLLLRAELRKLRRPLTVWVLGLGIGLTVLLAWGGLQNTRMDLGSPSYRQPDPVSCADLGLPAGPGCERRIREFGQDTAASAAKEAARSLAEAHQAAAQDVYVEQPVSAAGMAAGLAASFPGLALVALLAAGHVGGEWSGRTLKTVLVVEGRRWRLLVAKAVSLWIVAVGLLTAMWAALAATSPIWRAAFALPVPDPSLREQWDLAAPLLARALAVLAVFALLAVAAATVTRSVVGTLSVTIGVTVAGLVTTAFSAISNWTLGAWIAAWMRFPAQANVVTSFWSRLEGEPSKDARQVPNLAPISALLCLAAFAAGCWLVGHSRFRCQDVTL